MDERCQLYVGHDGDHAVLVVRVGERTLVQWAGRPSPSIRAELFGATVTSQLPWAPGCPAAMPASASASAAAVSSVSSAASAQPDSRRLHIITTLSSNEDGDRAQLHIA